MFKIIKKRKIWFAISGLFVVSSIFSLIFFGLRLGIDFTGGTLIEIEFERNRPEISEVRKTLEVGDFGIDSVQLAGTNDVLIRAKTLTNEQRSELLEMLNKKFEQQIKEKRFESIGPVIGQELKRSALISIILVLICIVLYIAYVFRKVTKLISSWKLGICAILALFHDVIIIIGIFSILGRFLQVEVDTAFVTAILLVLGYSVNDTIVVFDRIRFNLLKSIDPSFEETVERSVNQTLIRSINTSVTSLLVLVTLYFFGGSTIQWFILALICGVVVGTYSSIFLASPMLVVWQKRRS